jgi:hypothetical protein
MDGGSGEAEKSGVSGLPDKPHGQTFGTCPPVGQLIRFCDNGCPPSGPNGSIQALARGIFVMRVGNLVRLMGAVIAWAAVFSHVAASACTGVSLMAKDGAVNATRTVEWALGDASHDSLLIFPGGHSFAGQTPDGKIGMA